MEKAQQLQMDDFEFLYPPNQQLCKKHRLATRIWRGIKSSSMSTQICECCGRKVGMQKSETKCIHNSSEYSFLGPGIPLYFKFLKYSAFILIIFTLIFSIYSLYSNIVQKACQRNTQCTQTVFNFMSIINKKDSDQYMMIQSYMLLAFVCILVVILHILRYRFRKVQQKIDQMDISAGDYSIILKRLPYDVTYEDIQKAFDQKLKLFDQQQQLKPQDQRKKLKVQKIILSYDMTQYNQEKQDLIRNFELYSLMENKPVLACNFKDIVLSKPQKHGLFAIVVFEKQSMKKQFIKQPNLFQKILFYFFTPFSPLSDFQVKNTKVSIDRAPQPDDIVWQNSHISPCQRMKRKILLNVVSFILLFAGGVCQYGLAVWQSRTTDPTQKTLVGTAASIMVTLTNFILSWFLTYSTKLQRIYTQTQYLDILTSKLIIQQFLNSGIFVVGANILANFGDFDIQDSLSQTITQIMILNAVTTNFSLFFMKYFDIIGYIKRYLFLQKKIIFHHQLQANKLCELPKIDFPQKYSYIIKTLWLTAFYAPIVPIVVPISAVGLIINYFVEKILFSTSYSVSNKIASTLNSNCIQGLQYIPLILSLGQFIIYIYFQRFYYSSTPSGYYLIIYVCLALSFANLILPMKQFNQFIQQFCSAQSLKIGQQLRIQSKKIIKQTNDKSYEQAKKIFQVTYQMSNPVYQQKKTKKTDTLVEKQMNIIFEKMISGDHQQNNNNEHNYNNFNNILGMNHLSQQQSSSNVIIQGVQENHRSKKLLKVNVPVSNEQKQQSGLISFFVNVSKQQTSKIFISRKQSSANKQSQKDHTSTQAPSLLTGIRFNNESAKQQVLVQSSSIQSQSIRNHVNNDQIKKLFFQLQDQMFKTKSLLQISEHEQLEDENQHKKQNE